MTRLANRRGVSVIEILVSMVLLATGVVFALAAISYATRATAGTTQSTEATAYARKIVELLLSGGSKAAVLSGEVNPAYQPPDWRLLYSPDTGVAVPFEDGDFVISGDAQGLNTFRESASRFEFRVVVAPYMDAGPPPSPLEGLYSVDLQLRWRDRLGVRVNSFPALFRAE